MVKAKENFESIRQYLLIVFDSVTVEYDTSPVIRVWFEQNGKKILRNFYRVTCEKQLEKHTDIENKKFAKGLALDIMNQFIEEGI